MLNNTIFNLKKNKQLTIGYFGGSITEGAGASSPAETSWRALVTRWFTESYPEAAITPIQAAIGGTGSSLGIYRCERDLLSKRPDLVFIEFSVNDGMGDYNEILANSETIVRKIYSANPYADIVYVHTTTKSISEQVAVGREYIARSAHSAVMHRYCIPQIDVGEILRTDIFSNGGDWLRLTTDTVHPNDCGYELYTKAIIEMLQAELTGEAESLIIKQLPTQISGALRLSARLDDSFDAIDSNMSDGWQKVNSSLCGRYPHYIEADRPGALLEYEFTGRRIGLYLMLAKDTGDIVYSIDGGKEAMVRTWDSYCPRFSRAGGMLLGGELEDGKHKLILRVADSKADESEGHAIRIGAFMVY